MISTALATDIMDGLGHRHQAMDPSLRPTRDDTHFAGPAVTLNSVPTEQPHADPYGKIFEAYELMNPGDIVVIATNGDVSSGLWGELLSTAAAAKGVHNVVTDGAVRDVRLMNEMGFGCFCTGYSPLDSAGRCIPETLQEPVVCGGVRVEPGDFVLADFEGVVIIPAGIRQQVFTLCQQKLEGENTVRDELA
ncbi:uncharacterized protein METZ01_LOCUS390392, partial [marine metagenome]